MIKTFNNRVISKADVWAMKPSPSAFSKQNLKKTMKMTWLHMQFVLIFLTADSRAESGRTAAERLLTLVSLVVLITLVESYNTQGIDKTNDFKRVFNSTTIYFL